MAHPFFPAVALGIAGGCAALGTVALDHAIRWPLPSFGAENARVLLGSVVAGIVTAGVFTFWMRAIMVQLLSGQVSIRIVSEYLEDRFQQWLMGGVIGILVYVLVVIGSMPERPGRPVPEMSIVIALLLTLGAVVGVLVAVRHAVRSLEAGRIIHRLTMELRRQIRDTFVEPQTTEVTMPSVRGTPRVLRARETGWVRALDEEALLRALPQDTVVQLHAYVGSFVSEDSPVLSVYEREGREVDGVACWRAFDVGATRTVVEDPELTLRTLVDIGEQALTIESPDSTTAYEVIIHLRPVLTEVLLLDPPPSVREGPEGQVLLRATGLSHRRLVAEATGRLRLGGASHPFVAIEIIRTVGIVADRVREAGRTHLLPLLEEQAQLLLEAVSGSSNVTADIDDVYEEADRQGFPCPRVPADGHRRSAH